MKQLELKLELRSHEKLLYGLKLQFVGPRKQASRIVEDDTQPSESDGGDS